MKDCYFKFWLILRFDKNILKFNLFFCNFKEISNDNVSFLKLLDKVYLTIFHLKRLVSVSVYATQFGSTIYTTYIGAQAPFNHIENIF